MLVPNGLDKIVLRRHVRFLSRGSSTSGTPNQSSCRPELVRDDANLELLVAPIDDDTQGDFCHWAAFLGSLRSCSDSEHHWTNLIGGAQA